MFAFPPGSPPQQAEPCDGSENSGPQVFWAAYLARVTLPRRTGNFFSSKGARVTSRPAVFLWEGESAFAGFHAALRRPSAAHEVHWEVPVMASGKLGFH